MPNNPTPTNITDLITEILNKQENITMARTAANPTKALMQKALDQLAILGGKMTKEEDFVFSGQQYVLPERYKSNPRAALVDLERYVDGQEERINVNRRFMFRPNDGANATHACLKQFFGY